MQFISRFYQNPNNTRSYDYSENRIMGMFWSMAKSQLPYGVVIDAGAHVTITDGRIAAFGVSTASTPVILFDARNARWIDTPTFKRPGRSTPLQNAAIIGATMHIIRPGDQMPLTAIQRQNENLPTRLFLEQNYPNPFNPATRMRFSIPTSGVVNVSVFDLLGREVSRLVDTHLMPGVYEVTWDATSYSSGIYYARLLQGTESEMKIQTVKLILQK
jgi:hypothetical protein